MDPDEDELLADEQVPEAASLDAEATELLLAARKQHRDVRAYEMGGRLWFLRRPSRVEWLKYKTDAAHQDAVTRVRAGELLARACLVPSAAGRTVAQERDAFDALGEEFPALPDLLGMMAVTLAAGPHGAAEKKPRSSAASQTASRA
jgi:hypothetical protein